MTVDENDELRSIVEDLRDRVDDLEDENEQLRERVEELENQPDIELRDADDEQGPLAQVWIDDLPVGPKLDTISELTWENEDRISDIERGEIDPGEVVAEASAVDASELLPLHQKYNAAKSLEPDEHGFSENQELAARLFPYIAQYAYSYEGEMRLPSTKVRDIIDREIYSPELAKRLDIESPNNNTIRRTMNFVGQFGGEIFEIEDEDKTNRIEFSRDDWLDYSDSVNAALTGAQTVDAESQESVAEEADDAFDAMDAAHRGQVDGGTEGGE